MPELHTAQSIRELALPAAQRQPAATLRGVVTFTVPGTVSGAAIQDETAGIFVSRSRPTAEFHFGDQVELSGRVSPGSYAPDLHCKEARVLGKTALPVPKKADYATLRSGMLDSQYAQLEGIARDVEYDANVFPPSTILSVAMPGGRAEVFIANEPDAAFQTLVDSRIRVEGVVIHYFNARRQSFDFRLAVCDRSQVQVLTTPPEEPFSLAVTPVERLLQFDPHRDSGHRVRVKGIVSLYWPGKFLYLQDGANGVVVQSRQKDAVQPGDLVDVAAFASMGAYAAKLEDAVFRKAGREAPPQPISTRLSNLASGSLDAALVRADADLESIAELGDHSCLMLRSGNLVIPAELPVPLKALPALRNGSMLRVTGICRVENGSQQWFARFYKPESARLLLRSVEDIEVLREAPWWTARRLTIALAGVGFVLAMAIAGAASLHSHNMRLKAEVSARERAEAEMRRRSEERHLLAADLHDSLEQSLTGVALQLRAARDQLEKQPQDEPLHLSMAEGLLEHSRREVHRAVRDLRQPSEEPLDLAAALRGLARLPTDAATRLTMALPEPFPELPSHLRFHLLRLAQEGTTNALKHAKAQEITVALTVDAKMAILQIRDNGAGIDWKSRPGPAQGHFGLQGMKERAARLNGTLCVESKLGKGASITISLPLI